MWLQNLSLRIIWVVTSFMIVYKLSLNFCMISLHLHFDVLRFNYQLNYFILAFLYINCSLFSVIQLNLYIVAFVLFLSIVFFSNLLSYQLICFTFMSRESVCVCLCVYERGGRKRGGEENLLFFFNFFAFTSCMWDFSSPIRNQTHAPLQWQQGV